VAIFQLRAKICNSRGHSGGRRGGVERGRRERHSRCVASTDEEKTVSESGKDTDDARPPHRRHRGCAADCATDSESCPPPSPTPSPATTTSKVPHEAVKLILAQVLTAGNESDDESVAHGTSGDNGEPPAGEGEENGEPPQGEGAPVQDLSSFTLSATVSIASLPLPPRHRVALARGRAAQATKMRRF